MADGGEIAALFATLGLRVNQGQWAQGTTQIKQTQAALGQLGAGATSLSKVLGGVGGAAESAGRRGSGALASFGSALENTVQRAGVLGASLGGIFAYFGARVVRSGVELNATLEDSKNEVAGMLALANKSHLSDELKSADMLVGNLRERAAKLPGTTQEYIRMLSMITQPITDAKLGLKDLEDLTVQSVVAAKGLHVPWEVAARDIDQAIRGQFHSTDPFSSKVLGSIGYKGEEGRSRYNELDQGKRAKEFQRALMQPQFTELGEAAGKSFSGVLSTLEDAWEHFEATIAKPIFDKLSVQIERANAWLDKHKVQIAQVAEQIGTVLSKAFDIVVGAIKFFMTHATFAKSLLISIGLVLAGLAIAWIAGFWPIFLVIAAVTALVYAIEKLMNYPGGVEQAFSDAFDAIADAAGDAWKAIKSGFKSAFEWVADLPVVHQLLFLVDKLGMVSNYAKTGGSGATKSGDNFSWMDMIPVFGNLAHVGNLAAGREDFSWTNYVPLAGLAKHFLGGSGDPALQGDPELQPDRRALYAPSIPNRGPTATIINVGGIGDITVHSPNADPVAVGDQVRKVFHEELGNTIRKATDVYG